MTKIYDIEDMEKLTTSHEVQVAGGQWFPVQVGLVDDDPFRYICGDNAPNWVKTGSSSARESIISLCCSGLITGVREKFKVGDFVRSVKVEGSQWEGCFGKIIEVNPDSKVAQFVVEALDGKLWHFASGDLIEKAEPRPDPLSIDDPRDDIDFDDLMLKELYEELDEEDRNRAIELDMAKACVRKLNAHLHNL